MIAREGLEDHKGECDQRSGGGEGLDDVFRGSGGINHILPYVLEFLWLQSIVSWPGTSFLHHNPWLDIVLWVDAMCLVQGNLMYSSVVKWEEGFW